MDYIDYLEWVGLDGLVTMARNSVVALNSFGRPTGRPNIHVDYELK